MDIYKIFENQIKRQSFNLNIKVKVKKERNVT